MPLRPALPVFRSEVRSPRADASCLQWHQTLVLSEIIINWKMVGIVWHKSFSSPNAWKRVFLKDPTSIGWQPIDIAPFDCDFELAVISKDEPHALTRADASSAAGVAQAAKNGFPYFRPIGGNGKRNSSYFALSEADDRMSTLLLPQLKVGGCFGVWSHPVQSQAACDSALY